MIEKEGQMKIDKYRVAANIILKDQNIISEFGKIFDIYTKSLNS